MKRFITCLILLALLLTGAMSVYATDSEVTVQVRASQTEVSVGDTVECTVLATGTGVVAMQFNLQLPEGLRYVPNSAATPENLAQKLGVPAADWTELSMMFTFYNDVGITFAKGTEILRFSCVAEKEGDWVVDLYELLPFDENFEEFTPTLQTQKITVVGSEPSGGEIPPVPPEETIPAVTVPEAGEAQPTEPDSAVGEDTVGTIVEPTIQENNDSATEETVAADENQLTLKKTTKAEQQKNGQRWVIPAVVVTLIGAGVLAFILSKKKKA